MNRSARPWARDEHGSAVVEFIAISVLLLVPILYLVLVLGRLQAATFAAEGAAREAGRAFTTADEPTAGARRAVAAVDLALADQGLAEIDGEAALTLACSSDPCLEPGSNVLVRVSFEVELPFVPSFVRAVIPLAVAVDAEQVAPVDEYRGD